MPPSSVFRLTGGAKWRTSRLGRPHLPAAGSWSAPALGRALENHLEPAPLAVECADRPMAFGCARRHDVAVDPIVTTERIDASPEVVIPIVIAAMIIGVLGVAFRRTLMAVVDELAELWRTYAPIASLGALEHRPRMPGRPWFCDGCRSRNSASATLCYSCQARREEAEAPVPDSEEPAGASAGLSARTRRHG
jgi:hypothetical protein